MFSPDFSKTLPNILNFRIKPSFSLIQVIFRQNKSLLIAIKP